MMISHFESMHIDMWDVGGGGGNGNNILIDEELNEIPISKWTKEQKQRILLNWKARNALLCVLLEEEYTKVHNFRSVK